MTAVYRRELSSYFKGPLGYLFAAFLLIFAGIYTMAYNLSGSYANFEYVLDAISFIYLIAVPILSMRVLAEERKQKTDQLLYSLPIRMSDVVIGKYLAMITVLLVPCLIMGLYPILLSQFGAVHFETAYASLAAFYLLGAALLSIGLFISAMTENQVASAVICLVALLLIYFMTGLSSFISTSAITSMLCLCVIALLFAIILYLLTKNTIIAFLAVGVLEGGLVIAYSIDSSMFTGLFPSILQQLGVFSRFSAIVDGVFDLTAILYFLSVIVIFLFLTVQALEKRRWSE